MLNFIQQHSEINTVVLSFLGLYYLSDDKAAAEHVGKTAPKYFHLEDAHDLNLNKQEVFARGLEQTVKALLKAHKEIILVEDTPLLPFMPSGCIKRPLRYQSLNCKLPKAKVLELQTKYHRLLVNMVQKYPQVKLVSGIEAICNRKNCPVIQNQHLVYRDSHHLSLYGSYWVAQKLMAQIV